MAEIILINSSDNSNANSNMRTNLQNINETITNPSMVDNERQVKKSRICHPVWQYLSWDVNNEKKFESESKVLRNTNKKFIKLN